MATFDDADTFCQNGILIGYTDVLDSDIDRIAEMQVPRAENLSREGVCGVWAACTAKASLVRNVYRSIERVAMLQ